MRYCDCENSCEQFNGSSLFCALICDGTPKETIVLPVDFNKKNPNGKKEEQNEQVYV